MSATLSLAQMVDLALGTPEVGAVNFNVLHGLLHSVLNKLNIANDQASVNEADKEFLTRQKGEDGQDGTEGTDGQSVPVRSQSAPYHQMEKKLANIEEQLASLNNLPSNDALFQRSRSSEDKPRPVTDMWQQMQLAKRVDANEGGINKLMSLVQDMMTEMNELKDMKNDIKGLKDLYNDIQKQLAEVKDMSDLKNKLKSLEDQMNDLNNQMSQFPNPEEFNNLVTWEGLEGALRGMKQELQPPERVVIEMSSQTEAQSRPASARSRMSTPGPSNELIEVLEKLGKLSDKHDSLDKRVTDIEEELKNKADKDALEGIGVPEDLLEQLKAMQDDLDRVKKSRDKLSAHLLQPTSVDTDKKPSMPDLLPALSQQITDYQEHVDNSLDRINNNMDQLNNKFNSQDETNKSLQDQINQLEQKLQEIQDAVADLQAAAVTIDPVEVTFEDEEEEDKPEEEDAAQGTSQNVTVDKEKFKELEKSLNQKSIEMKQLQSKVKNLTQDMNRQLLTFKQRLEGSDSELKNLADKLKQLIEKHRPSSGKQRAVATQGDSDALTRMQQAILNLQAELERLSNTTQRILDDNSEKQKQIESLFERTTKLDEIKADKEFVQNEVDVKADKRHLDSKVNRTTFDTTCDELSKMISEILGKLSGNEGEWRKALEQLSEDLDGKLDRLEFGPFKEELEKTLRALKNKLKQVDFSSFLDSDEAAGLRKQIMKFNCISCDRPVDMVPQGPMPSIPVNSGLPATKSARPYTTFELDQIRQHSKSFPSPNMEVMDLYAQTRACGGSHTMTYPHRRITRMNHISTMFREEELIPTVSPLTKEEMDIQGADGHIYKGRAQDRLPNVHSSQGGPVDKGGSPQMPRRAATQAPARPRTPGRPTSARLTNRPQSARGAVIILDEDRPSSRQREHEIMVPNPPAPSEPDVQDPPPPRTPTPN